MGKQDAFIESIDGSLSPEKAMEWLDLDDDESRADAPDDSESVQEEAKVEEPVDETDTSGEDEPPDGEQTDPPSDPPSDPDPESKKPDILSRNGNYTIPYKTLADEREEKKYWREQAEATKRQLEDLQAQAKTRADAGEAPTKLDNLVATAAAAIEAGEDAGIFGDFSEKALDIGIRALVGKTVESKVQAVLGQVLEPIDSKLNPILERQAEAARQEHYGSIYRKHPDADSVVESKEFSDWVDAQPSFVREACRHVLQNGSSAEVIEVFDKFKAETVQASAQASPNDARIGAEKKAKEIIEKAKSAVPVSLTDIPGGNPGSSATREERLQNMDPLELLDAMADMRPEQIDRFLNRI